MLFLVLLLLFQVVCYATFEDGIYAASGRWKADSARISLHTMSVSSLGMVLEQLTAITVRERRERSFKWALT